MKKSKNNNIILGFGYWVFEFGFSWCKGKVKRYTKSQWLVIHAENYVGNSNIFQEISQNIAKQIGNLPSYL